MFPDFLLQDLRIRHISFNPVPKTDMKKVLQRIADCEKSAGIPKKYVDELSENSAGDVRAAINTMQFNFNQDSLPTKPGQFRGNKILCSSASAVIAVFISCWFVVGSNRFDECCARLCCSDTLVLVFGLKL